MRRRGANERGGEGLKVNSSPSSSAGLSQSLIWSLPPALWYTHTHTHSHTHKDCHTHTYITHTLNKQDLILKT